MRHAVRAIVVKDGQLLVMHRNKFGHQYYALVGGGIDHGESQEQALYREVQEEAGITIANPRMVIHEDAGEIYGIQYIYLCDYVSGEPQLDASSEEAQIHQLGQNLYQPLWVPIADLPQLELLPQELKRVLIEMLEKGFPEQPIQLTIAS